MSILGERRQREEVIEECAKVAEQMNRAGGNEICEIDEIIAEFAANQMRKAIVRAILALIEQPEVPGVEQPNPTKYWQEMYTDLPQRSAALIEHPSVPGVERLRRKLEEIHDITQDTPRSGVECWQKIQNIAATALSALALIEQPDDPDEEDAVEHFRAQYRLARDRGVAIARALIEQPGEKP